MPVLNTVASPGAAAWANYVLIDGGIATVAPVGAIVYNTADGKLYRQTTAPQGNTYTAITTSGALAYKGTWNASTNTPALASGVGTQGDYYVVSVAGTTNLDGITGWQVNDWAVFNGTAWEKIDNSENPKILSTRIIAGGGTVNSTDVYVQVTATGTLLLPAAPTAGRQLYIKRNYAGADYIISGNGNTIDGVATLALPATNSSVILVYAGADWSVF